MFTLIFAGKKCSHYGRNNISSEGGKQVTALVTFVYCLPDSTRKERENESSDSVATMCAHMLC